MPKLKIGQKLEVLRNGVTYEGVVSRHNDDGTFSMKYEDESVHFLHRVNVRDIVVDVV